MSDLDTPWARSETPSMEAGAMWTEGKTPWGQAEAWEGETPWSQPEALAGGRGADWWDEGPASGETSLLEPESAFASVFQPEWETVGTAAAVVGEDLVAGCGTTPVGPRPLLYRGTGSEHSRNPWVGKAQRQLNIFLDALRNGREDCSDTRPATQSYIRSLRSQLAAINQDPLVLDCSFGQGTETATKMFQACRGLVRDGKIGDKTWPELDALDGGSPPGNVPAQVDVRVRQDVWTLSAADPWHPTLLWYARGILELQGYDKPSERPLFKDARSWRHLAAIHDATAEDMASRPPAATWAKCEHGSWHFLPWHRVYLHHFEKIIRAEILRIGGAADWALPYWDYSDNSRPLVRQLPPAFVATAMPDGSPNPLRVEQRAPGMNSGGRLSTPAVDTADMFRQTSFTNGSFGAFGGRMRTAGIRGTAAADDLGALENGPHGFVHTEVGGVETDNTNRDRHWMSYFDYAGRDPIFWLHHANIDRLWEAWLRGRRTNRNPMDPRWLGAQWTLGDGAAITSLTTAEVVDPRPQLNYRYADMPVSPTLEVIAERPDEMPEGIGEDESRPLELVGASTGPVPLSSRPRTARVLVDPPSGPAVREMTERGLPGRATRIYLRLENIRGTRLHSSGFVVYVNLPRGGRPQDFPGRKAGAVAMFGVVEASRRDGHHSGSGLGMTFDVTRVVRALSASNSWNPRQFDVTFVPVPNALGKVSEGDVKVGRISLFYA